MTRPGDPKGVCFLDQKRSESGCPGQFGPPTLRGDSPPCQVSHQSKSILEGPCTSGHMSECFLVPSSEWIMGTPTSSKFSTPTWKCWHATSLLHIVLSVKRLVWVPDHPELGFLNFCNFPQKSTPLSPHDPGLLAPQAKPGKQANNQRNKQTSKQTNKPKKANKQTNKHPLEESNQITCFFSCQATLRSHSGQTRTRHPTPEMQTSRSRLIRLRGRPLGGSVAAEVGMLKQVKDLPAVQVPQTWWVVLVRWSKALVKRVSIAEEGCVDCSTRNHRCLGVLGNSGGVIWLGARAVHGGCKVVSFGGWGHLHGPPGPAWFAWIFNINHADKH